MKFKQLKTQKLATVLLLLPMLALSDDRDHEAVIKSLDDFFTAITASDIGRMRELMTPEGIIHGYRDGPDGVQVTARTHEQFVEGVRSSESTLVERYWDPRITVNDRMATVFAPYDVYIDGQFSHCGVNHFSMLKADTGWIIAGVVYSILVQDCEESPLGPFVGALRQ